MQTNKKWFKCQGCLRLATTNHRCYCPECRTDLQKQACFLCGTSLTADLPWVLCSACEQDVEREEREARRRGGERDRLDSAERA